MLAQHRLETKPRIANVRTAKHATQRRRARASRARYAGLARFSACLFVALLGFMFYVTLTSRLTSLNYAVAKAQHERAELQAETARLDDQLAALRSDDRLSKIAAKLQMHDPQQFAVVSLPPAVKPEPAHLAFLAGLTSLFRPK